MSRWSRRTQEEKDAILKEQQEQQQDEQIKKDAMNYASIDWRMRLLKEGELPLFCNKHGWVKSEKYTLIKKKDFFGEQIYAQGNCSHCNYKLETMIPVNTVYTPFYGLVISVLNKNGRIIDKRIK